MAEDKQTISRRQFLKSSLTVPLAAAAAGGLITVPFLRQADAGPFYLRPPGALDGKRFLASCIRCGKCVQACPYKAIRVGGADQGASIGAPYIVAREEPCQLCPDLPCIKSCPSGALDKSLTEIEKVAMGTAVIVDRENCLSIRGLRCEVCYRNCPLLDKAITLELRHNERTGSHTIMEPFVHRDKCVGCGICEKSCVRENAVIVVQKRPPLQKDSYEF